jgi:glyoxylase-like metal-dependent hydrolase (beta-lactamase superfamily II)
MPVTRRDFLVLSSVALGAAPLRRLLGAQAPAATFETIRRDVGYIAAQGGTIGWLINKGGVVVVDTQYARSAPACIDALKAHGVVAIDFLFNTHHHADHTGGNAVFKPMTRKIIAQAHVPELQRAMAAQQSPPLEQVYADATFGTAWGEEVGGERIGARHYGPGHTGGDGVVTFEKANVVHLGDLVFNELHPRVDRPGGASIQGWIERLATIGKAGRNDTRYIVGHAGPGKPVVVGREALQRQASYFDAVLSYVRKAIADGKSKAEAAALPALPGFESYASSPPILTLEGVLTAAYDELSSRG